MTLVLGFFFGAIGTGYLIYGKRQYDGVLAVTGILLMVFPYFVDSAIVTLIIGALLCAIPFVIRQLS